MLTPNTRRRRAWSLALLTALAGLACAADGGKAPAGPASQSSAALRRQIDTLIGDAACDSDAQCRVIGIGARACGGPSSYRVWSSKRTSEQQLTELVQRQAQAERDELSASGRVSDCRMLMAPQAFCRAGRCQAQDASLLPAR